jgi:hypothetical protein
MKSPPNIRWASFVFYVCDSIFKEYSDSNYLRSNDASICISLSGGVSAIITAPLVKKYLQVMLSGALQPPASGAAQVEYLPYQKTSLQIYFQRVNNISLPNQNNSLFYFFFQEYTPTVKSQRSHKKD